MRRTKLGKILVIGVAQTEIKRYIVEVAGALAIKRQTFLLIGSLQFTPTTASSSLPQYDTRLIDKRRENSTGHCINMVNIGKHQMVRIYRQR